MVEILTGFFSGSVALLADGALTLSDAVVSTIVWLGLRVAGQAPDGKFHFGYYRIENFSAIIAAFVMTVAGIFILIRSYFAFFEPIEIDNTIPPLLVAAIAAISIWTMGIYKRRIAKGENSKALKLDAYNTMKSGLASIVAFIGILLSAYFVQTDALAGIGISLFIFIVVYASVRESALVLVDACECPGTIETIKSTAEGIPGVKKAPIVRLRRSGPHVLGEMKIHVDRNMTIDESDTVVGRVKSSIKDLIPDLAGLTVEVESEQG